MDLKYFDLLPIPVLLVDSHGLIHFANDECYLLLGKKKNSLINTNVDDLVPMKKAAHVKLRQDFQQNPLRRPLSEEQIGKLKILHHDGYSIPVDISLNPFAHNGEKFVMVSLRDIRVQVAMLERLKLLSTAVDSAACGVMITDCDGKILWVNPKISDITGYSSEELINQNIRIFKSGKHPEKFYAEMWKTINSMRVWQGILINIRKDGSEYFEEMTIAPINDADGLLEYYIAIKQDVSKRIKIEKELEQIRNKLELSLKVAVADQARLYEDAVHDKLSGVYNRRYFDDAIVAECERAKRAHTPLTLVILDIDNFKEVNDNYGHSVGDNVIQALGELLKKNSRPYDTVCRYGGEEFVIILPNTSLHNAKQVAENWRTSFQALPIPYANKTYTIQRTLSAGVAEWNGYEDIKATLARADVVLYKAKKNGRNQVVIDDQLPCNN